MGKASSSSVGSNRESGAAQLPGRAAAGRGATTGRPATMAERARVGVLVSGRGTNMIALAEHKRREPRWYDIALVASNVPEARGLVAAKRLGLPPWAKSHKGLAREDFDRLLDSELRRHGCDIVALAGYMRLL